MPRSIPQSVLPSLKEHIMSTLDSYIVYLDDAQYAREQLNQLLRQPQVKRFVLVACAPRMTRRIGKWLSHSARENWRDKWCEKLFSQAVPMFRREDHVFCEVATGPLPEYTEMILKDLGHATVIDARRPKFGIDMPPVQAPVRQATVEPSRSKLILPSRTATA
jgi:hypothetical protein